MGQSRAIGNCGLRKTQQPSGDESGYSSKNSPQPPRTLESPSAACAGKRPTLSTTPSALAKVSASANIALENFRERALPRS